MPRGSIFHGSDQGNADQLKNYGVLRYAQAIVLIAALKLTSLRGPGGRARFLPRIIGDA
jgi:hypothetical protein